VWLGRRGRRLEADALAVRGGTVIGAKKILDQNGDVLDTAANSSGSESKVSSATLMKSSRFIPIIQYIRTQVLLINGEQNRLGHVLFSLSRAQTEHTVGQSSPAKATQNEQSPDNA
jgi:hypothetical protein